MEYCKECGTINQDNANYCMECGVKVDYISNFLFLNITNFSEIELRTSIRRLTDFFEGNNHDKNNFIT